MSEIVFMMWLGGAIVAYSKERAAGCGAFMSIISAAAWPMGIGAYIARRFYYSDWAE